MDDLHTLYAQLAEGKLPDPHRILGLHKKGSLVRLWRPKQKSASVYIFDEAKTLKEVQPGLFELQLTKPIVFNDYKVEEKSGAISFDPYAFLPTLSKEQERLFASGSMKNIYEIMGGRLISHQGVLGAKFAVWAPCAKGVSLIGDFNGWNETLHPMRLLGSSGIWELFVPGIEEGERYKFVILTDQGKRLYKADPFAFQGEPRPKTASVICRIDRHHWHDEDWLKKRKTINHLTSPLNIYELHLGSWKREKKGVMNYRKQAPYLSAYCKKMGYTHVELMPVMGHPLDESWGYQVTGYYAISERYGSIEDFQFFVDHLHQEGIGVILDWVPAHFPSDAHGLAQFDGTYLYEHADTRQGFHPDWKTHIFNYGRYEVSQFLIGSAYFYLKIMHVDGLRVDAVSSMVYLDFSKKEGEWIPNEKGGRENLEAISFIQTLNQTIHKEFPGVIMIAEKSHHYPGVTKKEGLDFDFKWSLGWMNDTLNCFQMKDEERRKNIQILKHSFTFTSEDNVILPFSHDEVVHEKRSLIAKMPGNEWQKFANLRLLLSYMICYPGKKLLFMGGEFGQWLEWECSEEIHWPVLKASYNAQLHHFVSEINRFYKKHEALWAHDFLKSQCQWVCEREDAFCYIRKGEKETLLCVHNFSSSPAYDVLVSPSFIQGVSLLFNSDLDQYGGSGKEKSIEVKNEGIMMEVPPLTTLIFKCR